MEKSMLKVGNKFKHKNGVCMYLGSKEKVATFVFQVPTDKIEVPHKSLSKLELVGQNVSLTPMQVPIDGLNNLELFELFGVV